MAEPFVIRVGNLLPEFFAHTKIVFGSFKPAGAISAGFAEPVANGVPDFFIRIENHLQKRNTSFCFFSIPKKPPAIKGFEKK